jgi:probable sporulation protein (polysaccharide deacetylase family)
MKFLKNKIQNRTIKIIVTFMSVILLIAVILNTFKYYVAVQPAFSQPIHRGSRESKGVAITCNIDWGSEYLPGMLEIFEAAGVKTAFFITGKWAEQNRDLTRLIAEHGHTLGNHGYSHRDHSKLDYRQNKAEIARTQQVLKEITGITPKYFAPPSGAYNNDTVKAAGDLGCDVIMWSIDTIDWKREGADRIISRVEKKLHGGGIILMHPTDQTLEALPAIITNIKERGYEIISLEDIVNSIDK